MTKATKRVIQAIRKAMRPPPRMALSAWADRYAFLSAESSHKQGRWTTLPYQRGIMDAITDRRIERVTVRKSARVGYALALDTPIATQSGWTTMGEIREGMEVFDEQGRPTRVQFVSPVYTDHDCYRVTFCDGSQVVADGGHRWYVEADSSLEHLISGKVGRTGRPAAGEDRSRSGVVDTETMARIHIDHRGRHCLAIPVAAPIDTGGDIDLPVPPYTLGLWLGDGHTVTPRITQHRSDVETAEFIGSEGISASVRYIDRRHPNNATIFLDVPDEGRPVSPWARKFRDMGVLGNKHIPHQYLRASISQRVALLQGIMDSDGTVRPDGYCEISLTLKVLADGVAELLASLGTKYTRGERAPRGNALRQYRVRFRPSGWFNPFRLRRKAARVSVSPKPSQVSRRRVWSVERVDPVPVRCIQVDSPNSLFLAGREMIPTHNTKILNHTVGYYAHYDPCPIMVVQPTIGDAEGYSKDEIEPMIRDTKVLRSIFPAQDKREKGNTILHKLFRGGQLRLVGADSPRGFRRVSMRVVAFDEVDGYAQTAGEEGDQIKLGEQRAGFFWNRKFLYGSTPTLDQTSRINKLFHRGDMQFYHVPCPHCDEPQVLEWKNLRWPKGEPDKAYFACIHSGCVIEYRHQRWMVTEADKRNKAGNKRYGWVPSNPDPEPGHASFHIWAAYSFAPNATWAHLAREWLGAHKIVEERKTFINTVLGETYKGEGDAPDWKRLYDRRELYLIGTVPHGGVILTAGVDVQKDRLEVEIVAFGRRMESWSVDYRVIPGDTSQLSGPNSPWPKLAEILEEEFPTAAGGRARLTRMAIDSGYNTNTVYQFVRGQAANRVIAVDGRDSYQMIIGQPKAVEITVQGKRKGRSVKLWPVGSSLVKTELYGWLKQEKPTDESGDQLPYGYCHFPQYGEEYFKQLTAEEIVPRLVKGFRRYQWENVYGRNEALDCRGYARAAAFLEGIDRWTEEQWSRAEAGIMPLPELPDNPKPVVIKPKISRPDDPYL